MGLKEYLEAQIAEKNLNAKEIERRSEGKITDTHIGYILAGKSKNPTIRIIVGLAAGLGVHPIEVFKVAAGVEEPEEGWTAQSLGRAIKKIPNLKPPEIKQIKKILKID
jgi:transcriptional regulator with XRE-family HTH domain